jgi:Fe-S-cluster containining protein
MKKNLSIPDSAIIIHNQIETLINDLIVSDLPSPLHPDFIKTYNDILSLFARFQIEVTRHSGYTISCKKQCMFCCFHWVEDVYSFEAEIIANHIRKHLPQNIPLIIDTCKKDEKELVVLNDIVEEKLQENRHNKEAGKIDPVDLLLKSFYQLKQPCVFLKNRECMIYEVRPLTCRTYISLSDPVLCMPENINESGVPTYLLDLEENGSQLLDTLHEKYNRYDKTGLRAVTVDYLQE